MSLNILGTDEEAVANAFDSLESTDDDQADQSNSLDDSDAMPRVADPA